MQTTFDLFSEFYEVCQEQIVCGLTAIVFYDTMNL